MIRLDAATVLLQWAVGGLFFCWVTTRRREVSLGYGWLLRGTYGLMALGALVTGLRYGEPVPVRDVASAGVVLGALVALVVSVLRRKAGVAGERERVEARSARVTAMTGIDRQREARDTEAPEFPPEPRPDRPGHRAGGLVAAGVAAGDPAPPVGRPRDRRAPRSSAPSPTPCSSATGTWCSPACRAVRCSSWSAGWPAIWPFEVVVLLWPVGMGSVITGTIDDGYNGILGWMWIACALSTIVPGRRHPRRPQGAAVQRGHGRHRPALPGHPHRLRHRPRRPRRPRLTGRRRGRRSDPVGRWPRSPRPPGVVRGAPGAVAPCRPGPTSGAGQPRVVVWGLGGWWSGDESRRDLDLADADLGGRGRGCRCCRRLVPLDGVDADAVLPQRRRRRTRRRRPRC